jgi:hypothetical protein
MNSFRTRIRKRRCYRRIKLQKNVTPDNALQIIKESEEGLYFAFKILTLYTIINLRVRTRSEALKSNIHGHVGGRMAVIHSTPELV